MKHGVERPHAAEVIYAMSLAISAILIAFLPPEVSGNAMRLTLVLLIVALLGGGAVLRFTSAKSRWRGAFLSIAVLNVLVVIPEALLRHARFSYQADILFGFPAPDSYQYLDPDPDLFWRLRAGGDEVNSLGFPLPEPAPASPESIARVLYLGDSCTQLGWPRYADAQLNAQAIGAAATYRFDSAVLAVAGYSSYQGTVLAERYTDQLSGDVATVYFGWNDHWLAWGSTDSDKSASVAAEFAPGLIGRVYQKMRLIQFATKVYDRFARPEAMQPLEVVRVSEDEYRRNLKAIRDFYVARKIPVFFITAPTSFYSLGVPDYLTEMQFAPSADFALQAHERYCEIVREVATGTGVHVVDVEREWREMDTAQLGSLFLDDGIHLSQLGMALLGQRVADEVFATLEAAR